MFVMIQSCMEGLQSKISEASFFAIFVEIVISLRQVSADKFLIWRTPVHGMWTWGNSTSCRYSENKINTPTTQSLPKVLSKKALKQIRYVVLILKALQC